MLRMLKILALAGVILAATAPAQVKSADPSQSVREMVANEIALQKADRSHWMYRHQKANPEFTELRHCVQASQGEVCREVERNGKPLTAEEQKKEDERIQVLLASWRQQEQARKERQEDGKKALRLLNMLPDAFAYHYEGTEGPYVRLSFVPNPKFDPPTREARVFHAMAGTLWLDASQKRLRKLQGHLTTDVEFGGRLLGCLYKGGSFEVQQTDLGDGIWEVTYLDVHILGKALFFKTIRAQQTETSTFIKRLPDDLSMACAAELLDNSQSQTNAISSTNMSPAASSSKLGLLRGSN
jgi:hypothetical protein